VYATPHVAAEKAANKGKRPSSTIYHAKNINKQRKTARSPDGNPLTPPSTIRPDTVRFPLRAEFKERKEDEYGDFPDANTNKDGPYMTLLNGPLDFSTSVSNSHPATITDPTLNGAHPVDGDGSFSGETPAPSPEDFNMSMAGGIIGGMPHNHERSSQASACRDSGYMSWRNSVATLASEFSGLLIDPEQITQRILSVTGDEQKKILRIDIPLEIGGPSDPVRHFLLTLEGMS
jgi:hypothetical protein